MALEKFEVKKSLGQHFLNSPAVPTWMCDAGEVTSGDLVLEIGPGTGVLTHELLKRKARVIALEADARAIAVLEETFRDSIRDGSLTLYHCDVRELDLSTMPNLLDHSFKVVANIPYYLSGFLFRMMLESSLQPSTLVYLVQKEVAKRITTGVATKGKESILSLSIAVYGTAEYVKTVTKGHFSPPPKIDSAILLIRNINRDSFAHLEEAFFFKMLHIGFGQKRKQLLGNLAQAYARDTLQIIFSELSLDVHVRAEDVPLEKWLKLVNALSKLEVS